MMTLSEPEFGVPDDENPEWTEDMFVWAVRSQDFGGDIHAVHDFLMHRADILRAAEAVGIPRSAFLPYEPSKPGFEARVAAAYGPFARAIGLAAE